MSDYQKNTFIYDLQIILVHKKKCWKILLGCLLKVVSAKLDSRNFFAKLNKFWSWIEIEVHNKCAANILSLRNPLKLT